MDPFTLTTGVIGIVSFILQLFDLFPKLGRIRSIVGLLLVGVCLGSFIRAVQPGSIKVNVEVTGFTVLVAVFVAVIVGFLVVAAFTHEERRRQEFFGVATAGTLLFLLFVSLGAAFTSKDGEELPSTERERLTVQELLLLVDHAMDTKDVDRAVRHLKTMQSRLQDDGAKKQIDARIQALEREAAGLVSR